MGRKKGEQCWCCGRYPGSVKMEELKTVSTCENCLKGNHPQFETADQKMTTRFYCPVCKKIVSVTENREETRRILDGASKPFCLTCNDKGLMLTEVERVMGFRSSYEKDEDDLPEPLPIKALRKKEKKEEEKVEAKA